MQSKSLLIAIAAFAVTTTGVHAHGGSKILNRAGLSEEQKSALQVARELSATGDMVAARDILVEAGFDEGAIVSLRDARRAALDEMHQALETGDFTAFRAAIAESPLADIITSEADFQQFRDAHQLRGEGELTAAADLFDDLGLEHRGRHAQHHRGMRVLSELNDDQREAFFVAKRANDRETMQAILDEAGVSWAPKGLQHGIE